MPILVAGRLTIPTAVMNPRRSGRERTTSRNPSLSKPRALVMRPIWKGQHVNHWENAEMRTDLESRDDGNSSRFQLGMLRSGMRIPKDRILDHLTYQQRQSRFGT